MVGEGKRNQLEAEGVSPRRAQVGPGEAQVTDSGLLEQRPFVTPCLDEGTGSLGGPQGGRSGPLLGGWGALSKLGGWGV